MAAAPLLWSSHQGQTWQEPVYGHDLGDALPSEAPFACAPGGHPGDSTESAAAPTSPSYRGRGPKGYRRSDERVLDDVCQLLHEDEHVDASDVEVHVASGEVTLRGTVPNGAQRRRAEELVASIFGVRHVHDEVRVRRGEDAEARH